MNLQDFRDTWLRWPPLSPLERRLIRQSRADAQSVLAQSNRLARESKGRELEQRVTALKAALETTGKLLMQMQAAATQNPDSSRDTGMPEGQPSMKASSYSELFPASRGGTSTPSQTPDISDSSSLPRNLGSKRAPSRDARTGETRTARGKTVRGGPL